MNRFLNFNSWFSIIDLQEPKTFFFKSTNRIASKIITILKRLNKTLFKMFIDNLYSLFRVILEQRKFFQNLEILTQEI